MKKRKFWEKPIQRMILLLFAVFIIGTAFYDYLYIRKSLQISVSIAIFGFYLIIRDFGITKKFKDEKK